jgi:hypothetical protein
MNRMHFSNAGHGTAHRRGGTYAKVRSLNLRSEPLKFATQLHDTAVNVYTSWVPNSESDGPILLTLIGLFAKLEMGVFDTCKAAGRCDRAVDSADVELKRLFSPGLAIRLCTTTHETVDVCSLFFEQSNRFMCGSLFCCTRSRVGFFQWTNPRDCSNRSMKMDSNKLAWQILQSTVPLSSKYGVTYKDLSEALLMASKIVTELQEKKQENFRTTAD